jgi:hypothetical protein
MNLLSVLPNSFFEWCQNMPLGSWLKGATWAFAVVETVHIMALAVLLGTMVVIDLRLLGLGMRRQSVAEIAELLNPWFWGSFFTMIVTGICLFLSEAVRLSLSSPFAYKMLFLLIAVAVHLTIHRSVIAGGGERIALSKSAACLSLCCWLGIALAGRAIAFL